MHTIVLAAGRGTRMSPLTDSTPKSLLPIENDTILTRLIAQIVARSNDKVSVVVGHEKECISKTVQDAFGDRVNIIENPEYKNDVNILSLNLAVNDNEKSFIVFESDCLFDSEAIDKIFSANHHSSWFTIGSFKPSQVGGILKADDNGNVLDIRVTPNYETKYSDYDKLIGVLKVAESEVKKYLELLRSEVLRDTKQYYLAPWINNLDQLPCKTTSLVDCCVGAFNTPSEYYEVLKLFKE